MLTLNSGAYMFGFFRFFLLIAFSCSFSCFSDDLWNDYQQKILSEHPNFSGWCPAEKAKQIMNIIRTHPSDVCVELGVFGGSSFFPLVATLAYNQQGTAYAIDPWENGPCLEGNEHWKEEKNTYWEKNRLK